MYRGSKDGKELPEEDMSMASEEGSMSSMGGSREASLQKGGGSPQRELVQELIEENTRLFEENKKLVERYSSLLLSQAPYPSLNCTPSSRSALSVISEQ